MPWPSGIPPWQEADLQTLAASGQLSGVNPLILAGIDQAESTFQGGGINSAGYGGFYGLGAGDKYPGGTSTAAMLSDPGESSFISQSKIAASEFASLLAGNAGNPIAAENQYQTGSAGNTSTATEGGGIVAAALGSGPASSGSVASSTSNPSSPSKDLNTTNYTLTGLAGLLQSMDQLLNPTGPGLLTNITSLGSAGIGTVLTMIFARGAFVVASLGIAYIGVKQITGGSGSTTVVDIVQGQQRIATARINAETAQGEHHRKLTATLAKKAAEGAAVA